MPKATSTEIPASGVDKVSALSFLELIRPKLEASEEVFRRHLASDVPFLQEAGRYIFNGGGKRIRPALVLLAARMLELDGEEEITYAAVVEYIHTATLVHDDIIDHAALRRGQPTISKRWGNNKAVLLGDWLYTMAMKMALTHGNLAVINDLCIATLRLVEGEFLALQRLGAPDLTSEEYLEIVDRKTACLFASACRLPAYIPPVRTGAGQALEAYGSKLGCCFQLVDDLLDFTASENELGKPVLSDLREGRLTLPLILLLPRVAQQQRQLVEWVLEDREFRRVAPEQILELVQREGTLEEVEELAGQYGSEATTALESFSDSDARDALAAAPSFVLRRRS